MSRSPSRSPTWARVRGDTIPLSTSRESMNISPETDHIKCSGGFENKDKSRPYRPPAAELRVKQVDTKTVKLVVTNPGDDSYTYEFMISKNHLRFLVDGLE